MELKDFKVGKLENMELLEAQGMLTSFLKYLNTESENLKRLEIEKS